MRSPVPAAVLAVVLCLAGAGCASPATPTSGDPDVTTPAEQASVRTDVEPLTRRFAALGPLVEAHWIGGRLGDDRVPGPSTYFIEAVVRLAEPARAVRADTGPATAPDIHPSLRPFVGDTTEWARSPDLDSSAGPPQWSTRILLRPGSDLAYISARGE